LAQFFSSKDKTKTKKKKRNKCNMLKINYEISLIIGSKKFAK